MALIARFDRKRLNIRRIHAPVECGYSYHVVDGQTILQLETYGSVDRQIPGKVSQSLQIDERAARELLGILRTAFPRI